ncbi:protein of unknown function [Cyclobacterium lianum]|uniref:DUF4954 domain-containing protein n=1 Tax=Cyclobacterium lianum TaxID=388280 RepID=A0A1M7L879_9BACT|nr:DUF4954 family protein [Cyclobacterium lianum]SHM74233.1 protein of unknown function [Cyclobacterium lianum]
MNKITRHPLSALGYKFVEQQFLPKGKDEYYLRNKQNRTETDYRNLNAREIELLVRNNNQSDDWNKILVADAFNPDLVKNCKFFGLVRIGKLEPCFLEYHNLRMPVGIYNSTIISCDIGDNVVIDNVHYLSHYILGNEVVLVNVNEMATTSHAKFGNGIVKEGEPEEVRIWLELCNENGGRKVAPFSGMLPGDAWLWSRYRADEALQSQFLAFTQKAFDHKRGYYGKVGDRCIIKNSLIIKDVWIGSDAYIKGANKLKNLTIHSTPEASTQIGEGCEMVNGIVSEGCTIFYGVKAVRFLMASHSQLKYGARLINSYLGSNATISCCEVLNSLIFPAHEQHHNNSFLCAALLQGQSNMAAGATVGSNHNSRGADGELVAGRGFWPGLCVSLKHNSRFATFALVTKGDYPAELDIPLPFALISNDVHRNELRVMPAYWFQYNMYALARNAWKYKDRDKRIEKTQHLEFHFLGPDSMSEVLEAIYILEKLCGLAFFRQFPQDQTPNVELTRNKGKELLETKDPILQRLDIFAEGWENSSRKVRVVKVMEAYRIYKQLLLYYPIHCILENLDEAAPLKPEDIHAMIGNKNTDLASWSNVGGQMIQEADLEAIISSIKKGRISSWSKLHKQYKHLGDDYASSKTVHAFRLLMKDQGSKEVSEELLEKMLFSAIEFRSWLSEQVLLSRKKDYDNKFRNMVYQSLDERDLVLGSLDHNSFIREDRDACRSFLEKSHRWLDNISTKTLRSK